MNERFSFHETALSCVYLVRHHVHEDVRGTSERVFDSEAFSKILERVRMRSYAMGIVHDAAMLEEIEFVSWSKHKVIRGMHYQKREAPQTKLVRCTRGKILDVVLCLAEGSEHGKTLGIELSATEPTAILVPPWCAHGFVVTGDDAEVRYRIWGAARPEHAEVIRYDTFGFRWPVADPVLVLRDAAGRPFSEEKRF